MLPEIVDSFLGRYLKYAQPQSSAPYQYHLGVGLGLLASAVRRRVWFSHAGGKLYPNLWVCLLGSSGRMAKTTALGLGVRVLRGLDENVLFPSDFSIQRFYEILKKRPQGTLIYREFKALAGILERDYMSGAKETLTDLYDNPPWIEYEIKGQDVGRIEAPSLNILSASTLAWFIGKETQRDLAGGWLRRFLFIPAWEDECGERASLPPGEEDSRAQQVELSAELQTCAACDGRVRLSPEAEALYDVWFRRHEACGPFREGLWSPFHTTFEQLALKAAVLLHLARARDTWQPVDEDSMRAATVLVTWYEDRLRRCISDDVALTQFEERRRDLLRIVPNGSGISQRDILRSLRLPLRDALSLLTTLEAEGMIFKRVEKSEGVGRPSTFWCRKAL